MRYPCIILLVILISCNKKEVDFIQSESLLVWSHPITAKGAPDYTIAMPPVLYDDEVVFSSEYYGQSIEPALIYLDRETGELLRSWTDFYQDNTIFAGYQTVNIGDYLVLRGKTAIDCINLRLNARAWRIEHPLSVPHPYHYDSKLYLTIEYNQDRSTCILRTEPAAENLDTIYAFTSDDLRSPGFSALGFGKLDNGDDIAVWKNRTYVHGNRNYDRTGIFTYNFTADSLMWRNVDLNINGGIIPLKISANKVIGTVQDHVFAMDLLSGNLVWKVNVTDAIESMFSLGFYNGDVHIEGDKIYAMSTTGAMVILDKHTGRILKVIRDIGLGFSDRFTYFEGKLFFSTGTLNILDLASDEIVFQSHESMGFDDIQSRIVIDEESRLMYFHNGREAFCVKMPAGI